MTNIEILQIIIALLIVLGLKYFYSKINKKIDADIEKETKEKQKKADKDNYWLIKHERELKETLKEIERIIETKEEDDDILELAKKLSNFLDRNDKSGEEFRIFNEIILCYYFWNENKLKEMEDLRSFYRKINDDLKQEKQELQLKQQELELKEARIVKIESAQKILNSELVEKINKETEIIQAYHGKIIEID
jgi:hypothetical protein